MLKIFEISKRYHPLDFGKSARRGISFKGSCFFLSRSCFFGNKLTNVFFLYGYPYGLVCGPCAGDFDFFRKNPCVWALWCGDFENIPSSPVCGPCAVDFAKKTKSLVCGKFYTAILTENLKIAV